MLVTKDIIISTNIVYHQQFFYINNMVVKNVSLPWGVDSIVESTEGGK